jgi:hypothetical protein
MISNRARGNIDHLFGPLVQIAGLLGAPSLVVACHAAIMPQ